MSNLSDSYWVRGSRAPPVSYTGCRSSSAGGCGCIAPQQDTRTLSLLECLYPHSQKRAVWIWPKISITTSLHLKMFFVCKMLDYNLVNKMIRTLELSPAKNDFKSVISIFCFSVSVGNISFHFQTFIFVINCNNPVIFVCSTQRSDHHPVCLEGHEETINWDRINPEELWQRLQDASRNLPAKLPAKLKCTEGKSCFKHKGCSHQMLISFS